MIASVLWFLGLPSCRTKLTYNPVMEDITQNYLKELFHYSDGHLYWKKKPTEKSKHKVGSSAGFITKKGYTQVRFSGKHYFVHNLIYMYHHGTIPNFVDHIDGNRSNNNIENLRPCTHQQNCLNRCVRKDSKTGVKGVKKTKNGKYMVRVTNPENKQRMYLGVYDSLDEAYSVSKTYINKFHGEFANLG